MSESRGCATSLRALREAGDTDDLRGHGPRRQAAAVRHPRRADQRPASTATAHVERKMDALRQHATQVTARRAVLRAVPRAATRVWAEEFYRLVKGTAGPVGRRRLRDRPLRRSVSRPLRPRVLVGRCSSGAAGAVPRTSAGGGWRSALGTRASWCSPGCRPGGVRRRRSRWGGASPVLRGRAGAVRPGDYLVAADAAGWSCWPARSVLLVAALATVAVGPSGPAPAGSAGDPEDRARRPRLAAWRRTSSARRAAPRQGGRPVVVLLLLGLVVLFGGGYVAAYYVAGDKVPRGTTVAGVAHRRPHPDDAADGAARRARRPRGPRRSRSTVEGQRVSDRPRPRPGSSVDYEASVAAAGGEQSWDPVAALGLLHRRRRPRRRGRRRRRRR